MGLVFLVGLLVCRASGGGVPVCVLVVAVRMVVVIPVICVPRAGETAAEPGASLWESWAVQSGAGVLCTDTVGQRCEYLECCCDGDSACLAVLEPWR